MLFQQNISPLTFSQWLWKDKENKRLLIFSLFVAVISFTWLKIIYPYPNFMPPDSNSYLEAAYKNYFINFWPIGYSRFLRLISCFSSSHFVLVTIQYLFLVMAVLYFLFSLRWLLSPGKWIFRILFSLSLINPLLPHIANFVSSDCLFATLSLIWFTQLLWILFNPSKKLLFIHALVLLLSFTVRFMAMYYPFISVTVILFAQIPRQTKLTGIGFVVTFLMIFIGFTQYEYHVKTGKTLYSGFGGWQMAANALYGYAHAKPDIFLRSIPVEFRKLHILVNQHMDSIRQLQNRPDEEVGIYYLWDLKSPLRVYMTQLYNGDKKTPQFKQWASLAPLYQDYGLYLIKKHPIEFTQYYLWPNLLKYYAPPVKFMGTYNMGNATVEPIVVSWFGWNNNQLPHRSHDTQIHITAIFPTLLSIFNPLFMIVNFAFAIMGGFRKCNLFSKKAIILMWLIWITNMLFSVLSAPTELRYQLFHLIITLPFTGLFIQWIVLSLISAPSSIHFTNKPYELEA
jgi:hypothetical protein